LLIASLSPDSLLTITSVAPNANGETSLNTEVKQGKTMAITHSEKIKTKTFLP
jgi:hypothetical protein